jgi:hypothetical protein
MARQAWSWKGRSLRRLPGHLVWRLLAALEHDHLCAIDADPAARGRDDARAGHYDNARVNPGPAETRTTPSGDAVIAPQTIGPPSGG